MNLRELAMQAMRIASDAGGHALQDQMNPHDLAHMPVSEGKRQYTVDVDSRLVPYMEAKLAALDPLDGFWRSRPEHCRPGDRFWCVGGIDGVINFLRNMSEWSVTISLFEFNEKGSAQPIIGIVHAPALGLTYVAARGEGAIRVRRTPTGDKREKIMPSTTSRLEGSVVSYGMSYVFAESRRALDVVAAIAGKPADIKRVGPASLDLCKVADGTYDAYFEPHLHEWDISAVSAGTVVVWEAQGQVSQWNGSLIHWRRENDVVASNGLIGAELRPFLLV
ncbi:MAG: inositol monophosphatase family protein [Bifidobacterium sp.]|jgi:myo-inositol-1(or 4)-monophosphatase|nr:inositol monophosphatase family protein [Bifidobacterium sp.]